MAPKRKKRNRKDDGFGFITDARLRGDIKIALGFSSYLIRLSAKAQKNYKRELRRVVILYTASVVEALCLFLIKQNNLSKEKLEYKYARTIVMPGVSLPKGNTQVVALQEKIPLFLTDIPFFDAINILRKEKILTPSFAKRLHSLREKRNSQHLYGRLSKHLLKMDVNRAFLVLENIFEIIRKNTEKIPYAH